MLNTDFPIQHTKVLQNLVVSPPYNPVQSRFPSVSDIDPLRWPVSVEGLADVAHCSPGAESTHQAEINIIKIHTIGTLHVSCRSCKKNVKQDFLSFHSMQYIES